MCKSKLLHGIIGMDKEILSTPSLITLRIARFLLLVGLNSLLFNIYQVHNTLTFNKCVGVFPPMYTLCSKKKNITREKERKKRPNNIHISLK